MIKIIKELSIDIYNEIAFQYRKEIDRIQIDLVQLNDVENFYLEQIFFLEKPTISEFAKTIKVTKPAATQIINKYIEKGFVEKVQSDEDKRVFYVKLLEPLKGYFSKSTKIMTSIVDRELEKLSIEDITYAITILEKIQKNLKEN